MIGFDRKRWRRKGWFMATLTLILASLYVALAVAAESSAVRAINGAFAGAFYVLSVVTLLGLRQDTREHRGQS